MEHRFESNAEKLRSSLQIPSVALEREQLEQSN
jgi:hypothetical protein